MSKKVQNSNVKKIRINKFLAEQGLGSRRGVEFFIKNKKVKINNKPAQLSDRVNTEIDIVEFNGKVIKPKTEFVYYAVNKPVGYTSTVRDEHADKLVTDLVPKESMVYPVGRLDKNSRGLIILTNDGELANKLTHPRFEHEKEYEVKLKSKNEKRKTTTKNLKLQISRLKNGVKLEEGLAKADKIEIMEKNEKRNYAIIRVVLHQGWKRQIRRMSERVGLGVIDLKRIRIGKLELGDLEEREYKKISRNDII